MRYVYVYTLHITLLSYYVTRQQILYVRISLPLHWDNTYQYMYRVNTITMQPYVLS